MKKWLIGALVGVPGAAVALLATMDAVGAQQASLETPRYEGTKLVRPTNFREWVFLSSGLGMTYNEPATAGGAPQTPPQRFTNVFVNPSAYHAFQQTGKWPNGTMLMLEVRDSNSAASINKGGRFQSDFLALEAHVKDSRFPDGWAFFAFGSRQSLQDAAEPLPTAQAKTCVECHTEHGAVERTFVQFYPTLIEAARRMGTYKDR